MAEVVSTRAGGARVVAVEPSDNARWLVALAGLAVVGGLWLRVAGLPGVDLHGPLHQMGIMSPTCGGTRATYLLVRGDLLGAWSWNPLVPLLAVGFVAAVARFVVGCLSGRWLNLHLPRRVWVGALVIGFALLEINQQIQADRLINVIPT
ncbi:DUF2752 domain-containing protein [Iamia majanohamensis]|uniref:DUF2752 domain-containing protein n=1 Tax=Iamia majanohamensis TaxID=467976 RepID=A0AAE9YBG1_9ACTN|nr:DUF2752 domain-containing protein [Iamia majanohamensis]WCO68038.1 DUF2752 domain-containing protein [Iamia majanohamensis]